MSDITNPVSAAISVLDKTAGLFDNIAEKITAWRKHRIEDKALLRLLFLEVEYNLELLETVAMQRSRIEWNDADIKYFINGLETKMIELVIIGNEQSEIHQRLLKKGKLKSVRDGKETWKYENVLQALSFVYVKVNAMKKIMGINEDNELVKDIRLAERMQNVRDRLVLIKLTLAEFDEVGPIARVK